MTHPPSPAAFDAVADDAWPLVLSRRELRLLSNALEALFWQRRQTCQSTEGIDALRWRIAQSLADVKQAVSASGCELGWRRRDGVTP